MTKYASICFCPQPLIIELQDKSVHLFRAFAPMLCKRPTGNIEETVKEMEGRTFFLEEKLDGERIQLHKRGNEYFYCSRSALRPFEVLSSETV
jgi:ATP-dependent DNA ligase